MVRLACGLLSCVLLVSYSLAQPLDKKTAESVVQRGAGFREIKVGGKIRQLVLPEERAELGHGERLMFYDAEAEEAVHYAPYVVALWKSADRLAKDNRSPSGYTPYMDADTRMYRYYNLPHVDIEQYERELARASPSNPATVYQVGGEEVLLQNREAAHRRMLVQRREQSQAVQSVLLWEMWAVVKGLRPSSEEETYWAQANINLCLSLFRENWELCRRVNFILNHNPTGILLSKESISASLLSIEIDSDFQPCKESQALKVNWGNGRPIIFGAEGYAAHAELSIDEVAHFLKEYFPR